MRDREMRELIDQLEEKLREQDEVLKALLSTSAKIGTIAAGPAVADDHFKWTVNADSSQFIVQTPKKKLKGIDLDPTELKIGNLVMLVPTNVGMGMTDVVPTELHSLYGTIETVLEVPGKDWNTLVIDRGNGKIRIQSVAGEVKPGDEVIVSNQVAIQVSRRKPNPFDATFKALDWDEIGGLEDAKKEVRRAIDMASSKSGLTNKYGIKPPQGMLLDGPPGNGKTLLARAAVTHLAKKFGGELVGSAYIFVSGPELLNMYVGATEANIRALFDRARKHYAEFNYPALLVIDEADGLLPARGSRRSSDVDSTIVPAFLSEMDGFKKGSPIVMLLTNRPETLDPAVLREGRMDIRISIPRPDKVTAISIANVHLKNLPVAKKTTAEKLAATLITNIFKNPNLSSRVSGAMIATAVNFMARSAYDRDESAGHTTPSGVCTDDILAALTTLQKK